MRSLKTVLVSVGLIGTAMAIVPQAKANAFTGFNNFSTTVSGTNPQQDITLQSVTLGNGYTIGNFEVVTGANIVDNMVTRPRPGHHGPASSDHGDLVTSSCARAENPSNADIVSSLGNLNMNCIVDTEDDMGTSTIDVFFNPAKALNTFFFYERGMNSDIEVQGIDMNDQLIGSPFKILRNAWRSAGYRINTTEIDNTQRVGSYGLSSAAQLKGLRIMSQIGFNGPDFKVVATRVPEPTTMLGLGAVSGAAVLLRRRKQKVQG
jgi:hypothetical protein